MEQARVEHVQHEAPALVAKHPGGLRARIGTWGDPRADEQVKVAISVNVGDRQRPDARHVLRDGRRHPPGPRRDLQDGRNGSGLGGRPRLVIRLPDQQYGPTLAVRQGEHGRLVVARGRRAEIDSRKVSGIVAVVCEPAAPPGRDQEVFVTVSVDIVPRDAGAKLAQCLGEEGLAGPVVVRRLDVAVAELRGDVAEPGHS